MARSILLGVGALCFLTIGAPSVVQADPFLRAAFFNNFPHAVTTHLHDLPSHPIHCGVCHLSFSGGGPRNHFGLRVQVGRIAGLSDSLAVASAIPYDSDEDGFMNLVEVADSLYFGNFPTFPGLNQWNKLVTLNIPLGEIDPYITPTSGGDVTAPSVTVSSPNGGEALAAGGSMTVSYTATDASGIRSVNVYLSDDGGTSWRKIARQLAHTGSHSLFIPNLPGPQTRIRVEAVDNAGNPGTDDSNSNFTITGVVGGRVASTLRDVELPGTQPLEGPALKEPTMCYNCHSVENTFKWEAPWYSWLGSMVGQAARDPIFWATVAIAEQDAPAIGSFCIRCHSPRGWEEGRAIDSSGGMLTLEDRDGVHCDFCHRNVDWNYQPGVSPPEDQVILSALSDPPVQYGNGGFISDPNPAKRGPLDDTVPSHQVLVAGLHGTGNACGLCHDSSNPLFEKTGPGRYGLGTMGAQHSTRNHRDMFPMGRTFSEWSQSEYAAIGVHAPLLVGNKADGIASTCQDCHMADVTAKLASQPNVVIRPDAAAHDFRGANTFIPDILLDFYPTEVDFIALSVAKGRATTMLQLAATLQLTPQASGLTVRVQNEAGHKLPTGLEGRRMWLNVRAVDASGTQVYESGAYHLGTGVLTRDQQVRIWEYLPGMSPGQAAQVGLTAGPSFHTALNDTVYLDNRIPPRGFTNAAFASVEASPVGATYADGEYWDDASYVLPATADTAHVTLYYQTLTKEQAEFLRDANTTNSAGQDLYDAWVARGRSVPVAMVQATAVISPDGTAVTELPVAEPLTWSLGAARPNPFAREMTIDYSVAAPARVRVTVFDLAGRRVRSLVDEVQAPDRYRVTWDGRNASGRRLANGIYFIRYEGGPAPMARRVVLLN